MGRGRREKRKENNNIKSLLYLSGGIVLVVIITFVITFIVYNKKIKESNISSLSVEKIADLVPNNIEGFDEMDTQLEQASSEIGKSIEEAVETIENQMKETEQGKPQETNQVEVTKKEVETSINIEPIKDPEFIIPVEGEIIRNFAKDSLIYSETLEEWITHLGIDIKADRTSIVKAAEAGIVTAIKNDPRYGLSIIIEHESGFKTIYSNLLTAEFVIEGEKIEKGQTIGTVGNSASFEIIDEPHLHFEILKDNVNVDPNIYIK